MVIQSILVGLLYWFSMGRAHYFFSYALRRPIILGIIIGLIFGDAEAGLIYGGAIQLIYMGGIEAGGNIPSDMALATCISVPAAIVNNLDPATAVTIAVPFGVLGVLINNFRRTINTFFNARADKLIDDGDYDQAARYGFLIPWLANGVLHFIPVFLATWLGPAVVESFINVIPEVILSGLENAGGMLPAVGFALTLVVLGKRKYLPFFVLGFFLYTVIDMSMITLAILGLSLALIVSITSDDSDKGDYAYE